MLQKNLYIDEQTGISNFISFFRADFERVYGDSGHLLLVKFSSLRKINAEYGREIGDIPIDRMGAYLRNNVVQQCYRHEGNGFLIIYKGEDSCNAHRHMCELENLKNELNQRQELRNLTLITVLMPYTQLYLISSSVHA